jgi:nucleotide-binding universal stress UspA family protein
MIKRVLIAVDGSEHAHKATALACDMASRFGADLIAVHVVPDKPLSEAERRRRFRARAQGDGAGL